MKGQTATLGAAVASLFHPKVGLNRKRGPICRFDSTPGDCVRSTTGSQEKQNAAPLGRAQLPRSNQQLGEL